MSVSRMRAQGERLNELDILRFVAAVAVVLYHYSFRGYTADSMTTMPYPWLAPIAKYGYLGVELFFMISGFVILMSAASGDLRKFTISRAVRLYPAFWVCCTLTYLVVVCFGAFYTTWKQYIANMTMLNGFVGVRNIDDVYWSLTVELRFYGLVAIVLLFGQIRRAQLLLALWLMMSFVLDLYPIPRLQLLLITEWSPYFIVGAVCFLLWRDGPSWPRVTLVVASWCGALARSMKHLGAYEQHYGTDWSQVGVSLIVSSFVVILLSIALRRTGGFGRYRWPVLGAMTYPLYLIHQNIGYVVFDRLYPSVSEHILLWGMIVVMMAGAYLVNRYVEQPLSPALRRALTRISDRVPRIAIFKQDRNV